MSKKVIKIVILALIMILTMYFPISFANGATISASKATVKPGETVELNIDLSTASIGYDVKINVSDSSLIESSEVVSKIGEGNSSRIYLVQLVSSENRIVYPVGTRIATIRYTIASDAPDGSEITFTVTGDVAGETSHDKNTINETAKVTVSNSSTDDLPGDVNNNGQVELTDYTMILKHVKGIKLLEGEQLLRADVNENGQVELTDYTMVLKHVKGIKLLFE